MCRVLNKERVPRTLEINDHERTVQSVLLSSLRPVIPDKEESYASTFVGTPCYCAPEVLKQEEYGTPADIWGLGCILIELATLKRPFGDCIGLLAICNRIAKAGSSYLPLFEAPRRGINQYGQGNPDERDSLNQSQKDTRWKLPI